MTTTTDDAARTASGDDGTPEPGQKAPAPAPEGAA